MQIKACFFLFLMVAVSRDGKIAARCHPGACPPCSETAKEDCYCGKTQVEEWETRRILGLLKITAGTQK